MRQAQVILRKAFSLLLCGRTRQHQPIHGIVEDQSVEGAIPLPPWPGESAMQNFYQPNPASSSSYPSEEQALSIAIAQSVVDQAAWQAARASGSSQTQAHQLALKRSAGEALSKKFWQDGSLGYGDVIADGFYDAYGDFPEVCEGPQEFPTLENLRKVRTSSGDVREVVLVDHELDPGLFQVEEMLSEAMGEANPQDAAARIRVVAHVVCDRFGGTYDSEAALERHWQVSSAAEKRRNRSAVVLLCRLEVGSLRHRALLFKVLADAVKLPCKLIRGEALCGADSAANAVILLDGREFTVDLVFDPGRLYTQDHFATLVQMRRMRESGSGRGADSWSNQAHISVAASAGAAAASGCGVETSAVSASSASSAGTGAVTGGSGMNTAASVITNAHPGSSNSTSAASGVTSVNCGNGITPTMSGPAPAAPALAAEPAPPVHSSPRAVQSRTQMLVPPVPAPGTYSTSLPATSNAMHAQAAGWGLSAGHLHGNGPGPAIAGSRVRFTITDLPKAGNAQLQGPSGESRQTQGGRPQAPGPAGAGPPAPLPAPPDGGAGAAPQASGRHSLSSLPGKAKSMVDLAGTAQHGTHADAPSSTPAFDLIRLDSEPLPESALHMCVDAGGALQPPERSGTPTGPGPGARGPSALLGRRQNSLDQNGWVKFSGSFTRSKDDGKPWTHHGGLGLSPLGQAAGDRGAAPPTLASGGVSGATAPTTPQLGLAAQGLELSATFSGIGTTAPSPDGTRPASSVGSGSAPAAVAAAGALHSAGPNVPLPNQNTVPSTGVSKVTAASAFANFQLPSDLSAAVIADGAVRGVSGGVGSGTGGPAAVAAGNTGGSGGGISGRASHGGSEGSLPRPCAQPQHNSGPQIQLASQQLPQPTQPQPPRSPFQMMQMGLAAGNMGPLTSAFAAVQAPQQPVALHPGLQQQQAQAASQMQQQQHPPRPPHMAASGVTGTGAGASAAGAAGPGNSLLPLPRMGSLQFTSQPQAPSPPGQRGQQHLPAHVVRQYAVGSHDSTHKFYGLGAANGAAAAGGAGGPPVYTPPPKSADGATNAGSKAPSPALSTPFTAITASSVQSTPPGSAPPESVPFADLSPFNVGDLASSSGSGRRDDKPEREQREREQREREQQNWEREREREREQQQRDRDRTKAQSFFADLSPFNTATGAGGSGSGGGDLRDTTPGRRPYPQPIVEMPSSDNSRETTPRVSITNMNEGPVSGPNSSSAGGLQMGATDVVVHDMSRMALVGPSSGRMDGAAARPGPMTQHLQPQQAFGPMAGMGQMGTGAHVAPPQQQQLPHHLMMSYYAAAMQGAPYGMYLPHGAAAPAQGYVSQAQGYMPAHAGSGQGVHDWRQAYDAAWANSWAAQQPNAQYMLHAAYLQQQEQQRQQHHQAMLAAAGLAGPGGGLPLSGLDRRVSMMSTTTVQVIESGAPMSGPAPPAGPAMLHGPRPSLPVGGPQLVLTPGTQPLQTQVPTQPQQLVLQSTAQPPQSMQQLPHQAFQQQQQAQPHQQNQMQPQQRPPVDLAHEMTIPSQSRLERMQVHSGSSFAGGQTSGLALQPSLSVSMPLPPSYRDLEISPEELTFKNRIGIGSYGEVYRGTWRGTEVAIKRFLEQNLSPVTIREFRDEVMIMSKLRHPNIVLFMGAVTQSNQLAIVTQFVVRGSLFRMLHRTKEVLDPRRRLNMALDIAKGMEYLHNCKPVLVHRDLKSPNLLVDKDYTIKVCDFGLSQVKMNTFLTAKSQGGSPAWMAPEILRGEPSDEKSDVFSFGVILYELVTGKEPWEDLNPMQVVGAVGFSGKRMALPTDLDPAVAALIQSCWATSPRERPSFTQILATMTQWNELRPTATVMQQMQEAAARVRQQRAAAP